jgi:two-component system chemotaxis sensor kinase CheA
MVDVLLEAGDVLKAQLARHQTREGEAPDTADLVARIKALAAGQDVAAAAALPEGQRALHVKIGPLKDAAAADGIADLFRDIPALGTLEPVDGGALIDGDGAEGFRAFKVITPSPDTELIELFSFHVSREQVLIAPWSGIAGAGRDTSSAPGRADVADGNAGGQVQSSAQAVSRGGTVEGDGYGFFVDPATLPAAQARTEAVPRPGEANVERKTGRPAATAAGASLESSTLRVSVEKVDQLINLVGELVITQAMLTQQTKQFDPVQHQTLLAGVADLERNTRHLQESVMSIRMIPMSFVFNRFPRMIRDLAAKLGKDLELKMAGEATELDKGLIEKIIDPLTHLVRNSADHGVESPARRIAAGKPATGTITLAASHQGGSILIEVKDDGAGLNRDKILKKARERGLAARDDMSDHEVWALIWEPGFSTADTLSDVSGRGVGMDVVRRNIAALGGTAELDSAEGYGTRVSIRLPLTLAIMDGMSIGVGDETYILPLASVVESFQVEEGMIQTIGSTGRVVKVREEYLPVVALDEVFCVPRLRVEDDGERVSEIMVIVEAEGRRVAALVDELLGQQQVVVKNLEANYRRVPDVSGATILGDGRVALIIDVGGLVKRARH